MQTVIQKIPENLQEFEIFAAKGRQPEASAPCFCAHWHCLTRTGTPELPAMNLLRGPRPMTPYDCQFLRDRLRGKAYLPLAYFEGATPENGYQPRHHTGLTCWQTPDRRISSRGICACS